MAYVKTTVDSLNQQKREYEKAVESLNNALEQIKKINRSPGKDVMLEGVRAELTKLSAPPETRTEVLLLMIKTLRQSGEKYVVAQKKAVAKSNQFRAHNRDLYGNPVVVTAITATATAQQSQRHLRLVQTIVPPLHLGARKMYRFRQIRNSLRPHIRKTTPVQTSPK